MRHPVRVPVAAKLCSIALMCSACMSKLGTHPQNGLTGHPDRIVPGHIRHIHELTATGFHGKLLMLFPGDRTCTYLAQDGNLWQCCRACLAASHPQPALGIELEAGGEGRLQGTQLLLQPQVPGLWGPPAVPIMTAVQYEDLL